MISEVYQLTGNIDWAAVAIGVSVLGSIITFAFFIGKLSATKVNIATCEERRRQCGENIRSADCRMWSELHLIKNDVTAHAAEFGARIEGLKDITDRLEATAIKLNGGGK